MLSDGDDVLDTFPLAQQPRTGDRSPGIAPARRLGLELVDQGVELAPGAIGQPAKVQLLNPIRDPVLKVAPAQDRWLLAEQVFPHVAQFGRRLALQCREFLPGPCRSSPNSPLPCGRMTAAAGRQVQSLLLQKAQASETCSQKVSDFGQALLGSHQVGRQGVGAGKAAIEIVGAGTGVCAHLPPALR